METKKIVMGVISIAVAIIVLMSMIPIFTDAGASEDTYTNEGYFYVDSVDGDDSITYLYEDHTLKINGVLVPLPTGSQYPDGLTIIYTEHICIRYDGGDLKVRGVTSHSIATLDITVSEGIITGTYYWTTSPETERIIEWTYTEFVGMVPDTTNRIMCKSQPQYVHSDSYIETTGLTKLTNINETDVIHISGSIEDGITVKFYNSSNGDEITTTTAQDVTIHYTEDSGHTDLYVLSSITFTATDGTNSDDVTYTIYTLPSEITAERTAHANPVEATLIGLIPLLMMVGIMLTAVALFIAKYRKN